MRSLVIGQVRGNEPIMFNKSQREPCFTEESNPLPYGFIRCLSGCHTQLLDVVC